MPKLKNNLNQPETVNLSRGKSLHFGPKAILEVSEDVLESKELQIKIKNKDIMVIKERESSSKIKKK